MLDRVTQPLRDVYRKFPSKYSKKVPFEAFAIVVFLVFMNVVVWAVCLGVLVRHQPSVSSNGMRQLITKRPLSIITRRSKTFELFKRYG